MGSLPSWDKVREGQAGTEIRDLVSPDVSPLLLPFPKAPGICSSPPWGHCDTGPAVTTGSGDATGRDAFALFHPAPSSVLAGGLQGRASDPSAGSEPGTGIG